MVQRSLAALLLILLLNVVCADGEDAFFNIYLDSDRSRHFESARSMEQGMRCAFEEIGNKLQGYEFRFVALDHRGNSLRSKRHMDLALADPHALAYVGGLHSPPLIKYRDFLNEKGMLTLVPWAAGGPITRYQGDKNWIFRLSVDDTKAGEYLSTFALKELRSRRPCLLLENTPWGQGNHRNMLPAIVSMTGQQPILKWFDWGIGDQSARQMIREIRQEGADCVIFVGNAIEGEVFVRAMSTQDQVLPIVSHWGITGGHFYESLSQDELSKVELYFLQTSFSFNQEALSDHAEGVVKLAAKLFPEEIEQGGDIKAPTGFVHAYDLGKILIAAIGQVELSGEVETDRERVRAALEQVAGPVPGLIKAYRQPFETEGADAHEALDESDFSMARFGEDGRIYLVRGKSDTKP